MMLFQFKNAMMSCALRVSLAIHKWIPYAAAGSAATASSMVNAALHEI